MDLLSKDPSAEVFAPQLFLPGPSLNAACSSCDGETPLLAGVVPSLKDRGELPLALLVEGGPSWITIEPRPLLY